MHRLPRAIRLRQQHFIAPRTARRHVAQRGLTTKAAVRPRNGETPRIQAVRFKKPGFTLRRLATIGLYAGTTYAFLNLAMQYIDIEIEVLDDMEAEDAQKADQEDEEESDFADDDSLFIPMTWAKQMPRTFYRGSDPEWQEFIKIAKDKSRHKKIQDELVQIVLTASQQHPGVKRQLGRDAKLGKYWLDISFPDGPPQEFERSGIEIGDGFIAWSQQRIPPESQWRLTRALWPKAAFDSLWASTKVLAGINYRRAKQALGWEEKDSFSPEERYRHALEMMQKQQQNRERKEVGKTQTDPDGNPASVVGSSTADPQSRVPPSDTNSKMPWLLQVPMPNSAGAVDSTDIPIAMHVFKSTLSKKWNPKKLEPPKGTFVVQGLVEVRGTTGRMLFDVQSCYDPKESKYVMINAGVRNFKRWNQAPRGGP